MATIKGPAYDPLIDARERHPDWVLRCVPLMGIPELYDNRRRVALIDPSHHQMSERTALTHAVAHLDLGHGLAGGELMPDQEQHARWLTAQRLLPIEHLTEMVRRHGDLEAARAALRVEPCVIRFRERWMHPAERAYLMAAAS